MSSAFEYTEHPHRRFNPLTGRWVLVSPHRAKRPWQGAQEVVTDERPYDPSNYLLPGAKRTSGAVNDQYEHTFVFQNDFGALLADTPKGSVVDESGLLQAESCRGECRVICFSPKHDTTIAEMTVSEIRYIVDAWVQQYYELGALDYVNHVQIFENKGEAMGCSNPHPHGQVWSGDFIPMEVDIELANMKAYAEKKGSPLLVDYAVVEAKQRERIVCENDTFLAVVPYWAVWPFETLVTPRAPLRLQSLKDFTEKQKDDLADIMRRVTCRYDNLFKCSFPYSMGVHQAPTDGQNHPHCQFHLHYYPPLLRSATVKKFMVGFEMLGESQRDLTAEQAAKRLQDCSEVHYRHPV